MKAKGVIINNNNSLHNRRIQIHKMPLLFSLLFPPPSTRNPTTIKMSKNTNSNIYKQVSKLLWGNSLPPNLLVSTVRFTWSTTWQLMMSQLAPSDPTSGSYSRPTSQFPIVTHTPSSHTLHLYVGLPCPWAHRTLIVRALKHLEHSIPVSVAFPGSNGMWEFETYNDYNDCNDDDDDVIRVGVDKGNGCRTLKEVYGMREGGYDGRSTVPMLWDSDRKEVVCNESWEIIRFFNTKGDAGLDLEPVGLRKEIEEWNRFIYPKINNGVYRCGFAQSQEAYDGAVEELFGALDVVEEHLGRSRYLCGDVLTLVDVCLFTTLIRFDPVYNVLFKCTKKKLIEYTNLHGYMRDIYQIPKVAATCNLGAIMDGYYKTLFPLNPGSIRPIIPSGCQNEMLFKPHNREGLSKVQSNVAPVL